MSLRFDMTPYYRGTLAAWDLQGRKAGDSWTRSFGDQKVVFTLKPGRPGPNQATSPGH